MHKTLSSVALLTLAVSQLPAQTYFTSPPGYNSTAGNYSFFGGNNRRFMGIDAHVKALGNVVKTFALRRNSTTALTTNADLTLDLGHTSYDVVYSEMDRNYAPMTRKQVFAKKTVNWTLPAVSAAPAPFDLSITLDAPYVVISNDPMIWDLKLENVATTFILDRAYTGAAYSAGTVLGSGCNSFALASRIENNGSGSQNFGMRLRTRIDNGPANTPVSLSIAASDANATVPGFCAQLHAVPLAVAPLGTSDAGGDMPYVYHNAPYNAAWVGLNLVSQAYTTAGGVLNLSNGTRSIMPSNSATTSFDSCYLWCALTTTPNASTAYIGGSILVQFGT